MKILTINCVNKSGSTGKIICDIERVLSKSECSFIHCYESGAAPESENEYKITKNRNEYLFNYIIARVTGKKYGSGSRTTRRLIKKIKETAPDIVHIHCPNTYSVNLYMLLDFLKRNDIRTVVTNHAEFFYTGNCAHANECMQFQTGCKKCTKVFDKKYPFLLNRTAYEWRKMKQAFEGFKHLKMVAVSPWALDRMNLSPIAAHTDKSVVLNGADSQVFCIRDGEALKRQLAGDKQLLLFVTARFSTDPEDEKGGYYITELARMLEKDNVQVAVVGVINSCNNIPGNMELVGEIREQTKLAQYYSAADLCIMASKRETFGMICAESLLCGTPVVGFKAGGPESIAIKEYTEFVDYGDVNKLKDCVLDWIDYKQGRKEEISQAAKQRYSIENMAKGYYEIYCELVSEEN